jgi:hypothetical protein
MGGIHELMKLPSGAIGPTREIELQPKVELCQRT